MISAVYLNACPNCGGEITADRLIKGLPCESCLPDINDISEGNYFSKVKILYNLLLNNKKIRNYWSLYYNITTYENIFNYFREKTGYEPWSLQKLWLRRLVNSQSFTMSAPTGLGKTTTIMVYSTFVGQNVIYIVPTKSLMEQVCKRLEKLGATVFCGKVDSKGVSVITINYLNRNIDNIGSLNPSLVAIDDADAVIKSGKTTDRLITLLGIPKEAYESAIQLIRLRQKYHFLTEDESIKEKIRELELKIASFNGKISQLVIASATIRPKGMKQKALRLLTGFEPASIQLYARNIIDSYSDFLDLSIVKELGSGGLVLVSKEYGRSKLKEIETTIEKFGLKPKLAISGRRFLDDFSEGKVDILVGSASYYGVAVRGIDEPRRLKYVIFYGVPKIKVKLFDAITNPFTLLKVAKTLKIDVSKIQNDILVLSPSEAQLIKLSLIKGERINSQKLEKVREEITYYISMVKDKLKEMSEKTLISDNFVIAVDGANYYIIYPDIITYLQGSGRASRLYNGGLTLGLSVILIDDKFIFEILKKKLQKLFHNISFNNISEMNLNEIKEKLKESRENGNNKASFNIITGLLIVESPTKAKTIAKLFSKPSIRIINHIPVYETIIVDGNQIYVLDIVATKGHLTDLTLDNIGYYGIKVDNYNNVIKPYYSTLKRCLDCNRTFSSSSNKCPYCGSENVQLADTIINLLKEISLSVDKVFIASDPDAEGEKIAYDIAAFLSPYNNEIYRIEYHEITKKAILSALRNPRKINVNLVLSQIVRRIEDRWIGFELSNLLKVKFSNFNHGAGRVQTPVLGWIVDKTLKYKNSMGYVVYVDVNGYVIKKYFKDKAKMEEYINDIKEINIEKISDETILLSPPSPFTTDTLLIEANNRFKLPANVVMKLAQDLFEAGLITYHRTDSTHVSSVGIEIAKEYLQKRGILGDFTPRSWGSEEEGAHEAIRPTRAIDVNELIQEIEENPFRYSIRFTKLHFLLYDLIFKRFIASQMLHGVGIKTKYLITLRKSEEVIIELLSHASNGFTKIYDIKTYNLPLGKVIPKIKISRGSSEQLLNYSDVISLMKSKGIGRPSTYAKTIENLIRHGYVISSKKRSYLVATSKGISAYNFLSSKFYDLISEDRTAKLMAIIDSISQNKINAADVVVDVYNEILSSVNSLKSEQNI
ncbi:reverse gyrase [Saccharolobus caldissimus]|uniref:Reverse gyrase n=1 Tax=Saccharolobus caldissimus TaxID=1702097 RepID=A0AAQ4CPV1_9CREN|nr:reverse gyrase [Saccharolobus caldissimus]BDB97832.1 reverse gyrase [Saccharolobus caldissimus]